MPSTLHGPTAESASRPLGLYLNNHLGGATAGVELAQRLSESPTHRARADELTALAQEFTEDRVTLLRIMREMEIQVSRSRLAGGWLTAKLAQVARGRLLGRRDDSRPVLEIEALRMGVLGKESLWRTLEAVAPEHTTLDAHRLRELAARAAQQERLLDELRDRTVRETFPPPSNP
ncbi:hypothetical protein [Streptomyces sp. NPDC005438]|uniref:hypothetical protein n=1 Tax=Streptomyces sp. NPDC005438 TaxID=3156880 RepID=UPI0033A6B964